MLAFMRRLPREVLVLVAAVSLLVALKVRYKDRVTILREGQLIHEGTLSALQQEIPIYEADLSPWEAAAGLVRQAGGEILAPNRFSLPLGADPATFVESLVGAGIRLRAFAPVRRSLEDLYMDLLDGKGSPN